MGCWEHITCVDTSIRVSCSQPECWYNLQVTLGNCYFLGPTWKYFTTPGQATEGNEGPDTAHRQFSMLRKVKLWFLKPKLEKASIPLYLDSFRLYLPTQWPFLTVLCLFQWKIKPSCIPGAGTSRWWCSSTRLWDIKEMTMSYLELPFLIFQSMFNFFIFMYHCHNPRM